METKKKMNLWDKHKEYLEDSEVIIVSIATLPKLPLPFEQHS